jgi:phosphohistidine swiveling domain-containing protein
MIEVEYRCEDGTPFPVHFRDEAERAKRWAREQEHGRDPKTALSEHLLNAGMEGSRRAYEEVGLVLPPSFRPGPAALGFAYFDESPMTDGEMAMMFQGCGALVEQHGSALGIWHERCLPETKAAIAQIDASGPEVPLVAIADLANYAHHQTMIPAYVCGNDVTLLTAAIAGVVPESEAPMLANELAQGFDNDTLRADQQLWELAQHAVATGGPVRAALASADVPAAMSELRAGGATPSFFAALDAFLADYGHRSESWDIACPTWSEQGEGFWAQLRQLASPSSPEPMQALVRAAARREALVADVESRLQGDDAALARFRRRLARVEPYVAVREERARWQVAATGAVRHAMLRRGRALVAAGRLERADDVLFLDPDEIGSGAPADVIDERRREHQRRCALVPPPRIGAEIAAEASSRGGATSTLRGTAASRGSATGRARVILDLADADRLEPGDVLVCVMTSPPWTPLFGLAAAVVVDTGSLGSHPAIAAREYGVPCVVGCAGATRTLVDGEVVTVDGTRGTVERAAHR